MHTRFEAIGAYLPSTSVSTQELVAQMAYDPPFDLQQITGIENRRVGDSRPGSYEDSFALALRAAEDCLSRSRYGADQIDVVISSSITRLKDRDRFYFEPSFAHMIARAIGARSAVHFDVSNACAGMLTGVTVLDRMIRAGAVRNGLVVSGERITVISDTAVREIDEPYDQQFGSLTVGDSAAAVVLDESPDETDRIEYVELMTCAEYSPLCIGMPSDSSQGIALYTDNHQMHKKERLALWPAFHQAYLDKCGRSFADEGYDLVIHHQVSQSFIEKVSRAGERYFGTSMPASLAVVDQLGNTSSTAHFVALYEHLRRGNVPSGSKLLLVPAASGVVTGCLSATVSSLEA